MSAREARDDAPAFAVVGHPNKGKSSLVATLARDPQVQISPYPGTTTTAHRYPMRVDGELLYTLVDTPGFQRPRRALEWLQEHARDAADRPLAVKRFVEAHRGQERFRDECELLAPVVEGAGIIYVVDGAVPYAAEYEPEMEILRWTGRPGMAVVNAIGPPTHSEEWARALGQYFSVVRHVDARAATFETRLQLLRAFGELDTAWQQPLARAVGALERERSACIGRSAETVSRLIAQALSLVVEQRVARDADLEAAGKALQQRYRDALRKLEERARGRVEDTYHHHGIERREDELALVDDDLFAERSWLVFGLKPAQLAKLGAAGGAATGAGLDVLTGGASLMLGAALGAVVGGAMGWLTADQLSEFEVINKPFGERLLRCGPARSANLGFVLLGRARLHHAAVAGRSHAQRDPLALEAGDESAAGLRVPDEATRKALAVAFDKLRREEAEDAASSEATRTLAEQLVELMRGDVTTA